MTDSVSRQGRVEVATVTFDTAPGVVDVGQDSTISGVAVASLGIDGVLSYKPGAVGTVVLVDGSVVKGIRQLATDGSTIDTTLIPEHRWPMLQLRAEDGGTITLVHDSGDVPTVAERCTTAYGVDATIGSDPFQVFCAVNGGVRGWRAPNWSGFSITSQRWVTTPTTTNQAINDLAERMPSGYNGITAGAGTFTVLFATPYTNTPRVTAQAIGAGPTVHAEVTARSNTGFTVTTYTRDPQLPADDVVTNGVEVDVTVVSND